jgi:hypothetical protein
MPLTISYPYRNTPNDNVQSRWFAAHSPIILTATRKDDVVVSTQNNGGNVEVTYTTATVLIVGQYVYIKSGAIDGTYPILSIGSTTVCVIDLPWIADTAGGWINFSSLRVNYYIKTLVQIYDPAAGFVDFKIHKSRPFTTGIAKIDITRSSKSSVNMRDTFSHSAINMKDINLSSRLKVIFTEVWDGSAEAPVDGDEMYFVNAAMQPGHRFASNMADFMMIASGADKAKFLTTTTKLRYWKGFPFDLSFIYPLALGATAINKRELTNAGNNNISDDPYAIDVTQVGWVNRLMLQEGYDVTDPNIDNVDVYIEVDAGSVRMTDMLNIRLMCVPKNAVYLKWVNTGNSGWHYWLFGIKQTRGLKTAIGGRFSKYVEDIGLAESTSEILEKTAIPEMQLIHERLDTYDVDLMESLQSSPRVMWLMNPDDWATTAEQWMTVEVEAGTIPTRNTRNVFNKAEFKILLPELSIQTQ